MLSRFSIGAKLTLGLVLLFAVIVGSSLWTYVLVTGLQRNYSVLLDRSYPMALAAKQLQVETMTQAQAIMAFAATLDQAYVANINNSKDISQQLFAELQENTGGDAEAGAMVAEISGLRERFMGMVDRVISFGGEVGSAQLIQIADDARNLGSRAGAELEKLIEHEQQKVQLARRAAEERAYRAVQMLLGLSLAMVATGLVMGAMAYRGIVLPLRSLADRLRVIASGTADLTQQVPVSSSDEVGQLADSFNQLVRGIGDIVRQTIRAAQEVYGRSRRVQETISAAAAASQQVVTAVDHVASGAQRQSLSAAQVNSTMSELAAAVAQIATGAQRQAHEVESATALVNRMVESMDNVAQNASAVATASEAAASEASKGNEMISAHLQGLQRVREQVVEGVNSVQDLGQYTSRIGEILKVITHIAGRTNLLALNAAIEAARAGEHGRGFAVVAEEIRQLAERSASAVKEIRTLVESIQAGTSRATRAIQDSTKDVEKGFQMGVETGNALRAILATVQGTASTIGEISAVADQVRDYSRQVAAAVSQVHLVTQEHTAATEQMAAAADTITSQIAGVSEVSESNSATVEEVAASMQEMDRSVSAIASSADELLAIAEQLRALVGQFKV